ncbi:MAG: alpha/beta hydrolase [Chloroflexi bacterium]|nr:MAG: alpha/beta hydrolase [Chloroflexota bacterium]
MMPRPRCRRAGRGNDVPIETLNGIDFYYEVTGEGPTVTFLHGAGGNHISWWQQIPVFRDRYRCITIDHRGFNRSTDPKQEGASRLSTTSRCCSSGSASSAVRSSRSPWMGAPPSGSPCAIRSGCRRSRSATTGAG